MTQKCYFSNTSKFMLFYFYSRRDVLKQHLLIHYKNDIKKQYITNDDTNQCPLCDFEAKDLKSLLQHLAIKTHMKLKEFLPGFAAEVLFSEKIPKAERNSVDSMEKFEEKSWMCCVCQQKFTERYQLTDHIGKRNFFYYLRSLPTRFKTIFKN